MDNPQAAPKEAPKEAKKEEMNYEPRRVKMVSPSQAREPANVQIKALSQIRINDNLILETGEEAYVTETQAKEFCRVIPGQYSFSGERDVKDSPRHQTVRAERVGTQTSR